MKKMAKFAILLLVSLVVVVSCVSGDFAEVTQIPDGKALVYAYRPSEYSGFGLTYDLKVEGEKVGKLANGSYFYFFLEPGEHMITAKTEAESTAYLEIEAGGTYYIRGGVKTGIMIGRPDITAVSSLQGRSEIIDCRYDD